MVFVGFLFWLKREDLLLAPEQVSFRFAWSERGCAPVSQQSSLEALNRALGDCTRGVSGMRDVSVERKAFITLMHRAHSRRKKLGEPVSDKPFDFLFATQEHLVDELWPRNGTGDGATKTTRVFVSKVPVEPMGLEFNKMLKRLP